jgi:peptidoglycan/LPS O-acetylase OafA/YrhL
MQNRVKQAVIRPLTGIRGLTVAWVVLYHFGDAINVMMPALKPLVLLTERLKFRMDFLFLLSGFFLAYVYIQRQERFSLKAYRGFLWARFCRIYPAYLASVLVLVFELGFCRMLGLTIYHPENYQLQTLPFRLALLSAWPFLADITYGWITPSWFLSALWFSFLFAVPWIWKLFPKLRASRSTLPCVFAVILAYMLLREIAVLAEFQKVLQACCEMVSGAAVCALYVERKPFVAAMQRHLDKIVLLFIVSSLLVLLVSSPWAPQIANWVLLLACPMLLAGLTAERSLTARLFATRLLLWVGKISYSLYVSHYVVLGTLARLLPPAQFAESPLYMRWAILALYVFAVLICALCMYELVEVPCVRALKQRSVRRSSLPRRRMSISQQPTQPVEEAASAPPQEY